MYDVEMEGDQPPLKDNKELTVLRTIIDEVSCDASTQTINLRSEGHFTRFTSTDDKPSEINKRAHGPHSKSKKSSFRLLIVPDDPDSEALNDSSLRLSFDEEHHKSSSQSLRVLVASTEWNEKNEAIEFRHDCKNMEKNKSRNTFKQKECLSKNRDTSAPVSLEKCNGNPRIDHQLRNSRNTSVLAWLRLKNFEEREKRRCKKQEKKELRRHAYEEAEKRQKHIKESEKRFAQWLTAKKKESRRAWKEKYARKRVDTVKKEEATSKDNDPPLNYTVVPTFKGLQAWAEAEEVSRNIGTTSENTNTKSIVNVRATKNGSVNRYETGDVLSSQDDITEPSQFSKAALETGSKEQTRQGNIAITTEKNLSKQARFDITNGKSNNRPATAGSRLLSAPSTNGSRRLRRNTQENWQEMEGNHKIPSTSGNRMTSHTDTMDDKKIGMTHEAWVVQKRKEQKLKRPTSADTSHLEFKTDEGHNRKSITFEAWMAQKQEERKERAKQKKREVVDEALTEAIMKMATRRMENSSKEKRELDTGIPRWRARNRAKSAGAEKSARALGTSCSS